MIQILILLARSAPANRQSKSILFIFAKDNCYLFFAGIKHAFQRLEACQNTTGIINMPISNRVVQIVCDSLMQLRIYNICCQSGSELCSFFHTKFVFSAYFCGFFVKPKPFQMRASICSCPSLKEQCPSGPPAFFQCSLFYLLSFFDFFDGFPDITIHVVLSLLLRIDSFEPASNIPCLNLYVNIKLKNH